MVQGGFNPDLHAGLADVLGKKNRIHVMKIITVQ